MIPPIYLHSHPIAPLFGLIGIISALRLSQPNKLSLDCSLLGFVYSYPLSFLLIDMPLKDISLLVLVMGFHKN